MEKSLTFKNQFEHGVSEHNQVLFHTIFSEAVIVAGLLRDALQDFAGNMNGINYWRAKK